MTKLLDLPNEMLEVIVKHAVYKRSGKPDIGTARSLRLVNTRLGEHAEAHMFKRVAVAFSDADFLQGQNPLIHLLSFPPAKKHMKRLRLDVSVPNKVEDYPSIWNSILSGIDKAIELLLQPSSSNVKAGETVALSGVVPGARLPYLKEIVIKDRACALLLPFLAGSAPLLAEVRLAVESNRLGLQESEEIIEKFLIERNYHKRVSEQSVQDLKRLKIQYFGSAWISQLLDFWKVRPIELVIYSSSTNHWEGNYHKSIVNAAAWSGFKKFKLVQDGLDTYNEDVILNYMSKRAKFFEGLCQQWAGRGISMSLNELMPDWRYTVREARVDNEDIKREYVFEMLPTFTT